MWTWRQKITKGQTRQSASKYIDLLDSLLEDRDNANQDESNRLKISKIIFTLKNRNIAELVLKSFLYQVLGNNARSQKIIIEFMSRSPVENWIQMEFTDNSLIQWVELHFKGLLTKLIDHSSDDRVFRLFIKKKKNFLSDSQQKDTVGSFKGADLAILSQSYTNHLVPEWSLFLKWIKKEKLKKEDVFKKKWQKYLILTKPSNEGRYSQALKVIDPNQDHPISKLELYILSRDDDFALQVFPTLNHSSFKKKRQNLKEILRKKSSFIPLYLLYELGDISPETIALADQI